jgi:hypothetical protein
MKSASQVHEAKVCNLLKQNKNPIKLTGKHPRGRLIVRSRWEQQVRKGVTQTERKRLL